MKLKHFTIIEVGSDADCRMIGTIMNVSEKFQDTVKSRLQKALQEHFDVEDVTIFKIPNLFDGSAIIGLTVEIDGNDFEIELLETWLY